MKQIEKKNLEGESPTLSVTNGSATLITLIYSYTVEINIFFVNYYCLKFKYSKTRVSTSRNAQGVLWNRSS